MIQAGKLRHRVVIQKPVETQDQNDGSVIVRWEDIATVWASIEPLSAKEFIAAQAEASKVTTRITVRYRNDVTAKMRLYHPAKGFYYNIEGVLSDRTSGLEYLTLPCSEGVRYQEGEPSAVIPDALIAPVISGNAVAGQTLTVSNGVWANDPVSYSYQWYVNDLPVEGATGSAWLVDATLNDIITVSVVATNAAGNGEPSFSNGVLVVI